jgi:hypothetical protein
MGIVSDGTVVQGVIALRLRAQFDLWEQGKEKGKGVRGKGRKEISLTWAAISSRFMRRGSLPRDAAVTLPV